jgi:YD repeat-containing protein
VTSESSLKSKAWGKIPKQRRTRTSTVSDHHDHAGRLAGVTIDRTGGGGGVTATTFAYDDDGNRVSRAVEDAEGTATTTYLIDENNLTG